MALEDSTMAMVLVRMCVTFHFHSSLCSHGHMYDSSRSTCKFMTVSELLLTFPSPITGIEYCIYSNSTTSIMKFSTAISAATYIFFVTARVIKPSSTSPNPETNDFQLITAFWDDDYASPSEWITYTTKGGALMCGLTGSDETAGSLLQDTRNPPSAASPFTNDLKSELLTWHWRSVNPSSFSCSFSTHWNFPHAMRSLGLSGTSATQGGDNHCYRIEHWDPDMRDERGNQVPAINQWYSVPGMGRQYRVSLCPLSQINIFEKRGKEIRQKDGNKEERG